MEIGIIGAGAAAVGLLDALAQIDARPGGITVFDGSTAMWRGRPYQPDLASVRVNAPPMIMSIRAGDQTHYQRWLRDFDDSAAYLDEKLGQPLLPRGRYGEYLEHTAHAAIIRLRRDGWRVSVVHSQVTRSSYDGKVLLHTESGARVPVDRAVLGVGSGHPRDHYGLANTPGYINEPYPLARTVSAIPADHHVAVIGSGLTAIDIAAALTDNGHTGTISLLSRGGVLPYVQQRPVRLEPRHLTPENVRRLAAEHGTVGFDQLVALMRSELADLGQDFDSLAAEVQDTATEDPIVRLRRQLAAVDSPHHGRRLLAMAIRTVGPIAWPLLPEQDRAALRHEHLRTINSLSSPMVPHNANIVLGLLDSGQLRLSPGITKIEAAANGGFTIFDGTEWTADTVLNAVNPSAYTTPQGADSLVNSLLAAGAAELHPAGGLVAEPGTRRLLVDGQPDPTWHVLGNLAADSMFIATNPPGLAAEAAVMARDLVRE